MLAKSHAQIFFIIDATEATIDSSLSLKDVIGTGHRLDVICRELVAALWWGSQMLRHVTTFIAFKHQPALQIDGYLLPEPVVPKTELGFARLLKDIYVNKARIAGFNLLQKQIGEIVQDLLDDGVSVWWLEEGGRDFREMLQDNETVQGFILGDHRGMSMDFTTRFGAWLPRISLGPHSYLGSTCIQILLGRQ